MLRELPLSERVDYWSRELQDTDAWIDALQANGVALKLGECYAEAKAAAAGADTNRQLIRLEREAELVRSGAVSKTDAAKLVVGDEIFRDAATAAQISAELRDRAEVYFSIARQRAWILAGMVPETVPGGAPTMTKAKGESYG